MSIETNDGIVEGVHGYGTEEKWIKPSPRILEHLEWFMDQKVGIMMHFGLYSQLGIIESWPLVDDDKSWSRANIDWEQDGDKFRETYFSLNKSFNPVALQPHQLADIADRNGFKYLCFTTKHCEGFCLWDTKTTDFKSTNSDCPFHTHQYANIVKHVFNAFREKGMGISCYYSKADWHSPYFWAPDMDRKVGQSRHATYDTKEHPELWEKYIRFCHEQILELVSEYGNIDVLWLDAGNIKKEFGQDIRLSEVIEKAREIQPNLIVANRCAGDEFEDFLTPEQVIPPSPIFVPWEACITLSKKSFSYFYDDDYKSFEEVISILINVICKGGNLLLNVAPTGSGQYPPKIIEKLDQIGAWLRKYGNAVYKTRVCAPYKKDGIAYTQNKESVFAFVDNKQGEISISTNEKIEKIICMTTGKEIHFIQKGNEIIFHQEQTNEFVVVYNLIKGDICDD